MSTQPLLEDGANMKDENARLATYTNWPVQFLEPQRMAANGFYYLGRSDEVRCAFCKVEIMRWMNGDDPESDHKKWAPRCPFLRRSDVAQESAGVHAPQESVGVHAPQESVGVHAPQESVGVHAPQESAGVHAPRECEATNKVSFPVPVHPEYAIEAARLRTFTAWPRGLKQHPEILAEAGFFYTGKSDKVKCFYCNGGLNNWEQDDDPWQQHALWFGRCAYVLLVKGHDYVQKVVTESCVVRNTNKKQVVEQTVYEPNTPDEQLCKICYDAKKTVCFVPCGHVMACGKCASTLTICPYCRANVETPVRMYQV
ncbi:IAP-3 [Choristoneura rosaceana nucleopolyhedrovirus]|uniref:IAP-3 n=1 Tax=Choristoneura rosaceana nucleopolyhedrovirus TaxID=58094 RepID=S5MRD5_9ABAC|nr:IAP-3 [Choristoneura rosaceana nucleopolyhedrovirus]AGR57154.1 IAP-3 [Choristoneura rosaceana nucleopolyhedrovirus]